LNWIKAHPSQLFFPCIAISSFAILFLWRK
jgi:hypothetical protein